MGDNDTRTDAKRLALLDAKRLALEQAGTYLESITEVKNLQVTHDELRAYTAGIIEVLEQKTTSLMEGQQQVVRVEVTARIDTVVVARQIDALRRNESGRAELLRLQAEGDQLRKELEAKTSQLAQVKSKSEASRVRGERYKLLKDAETWDKYIGAIVLSLRDEERPGSLRQAIAMVTDLAAQNPSSPDSFLTLGFIHMVNKNRSEAAKYYRKAIELEPQAARPHYYLASVLLGLGKRDEAINELRVAIKLDPSDAEAHAGLGALLEKEGKTDEALKEVQIASHLAPSDAMYHGVLGRFLDEQGRTIEALAEYEESVELFHANHLENLGMGRDSLTAIRYQLQKLQRELNLGKLNCSKEFYTLTSSQKLRVFDSVASVDDLYQAASNDDQNEVKKRLFSQTDIPESCSQK